MLKTQYFRSNKNQCWAALIQSRFSLKLRWIFQFWTALIQRKSELISSETKLISADVFHVIWISADSTEKHQISETALFRTDYLWDFIPGNLCFLCSFYQLCPPPPQIFWYTFVYFDHLRTPPTWAARYFSHLLRICRNQNIFDTCSVTDVIYEGNHDLTSSSLAWIDKLGEKKEQRLMIFLPDYKGRAQSEIGTAYRLSAKNWVVDSVSRLLVSLCCLKVPKNFIGRVLWCLWEHLRLHFSLCCPTMKFQ